MKSSLLLLTSLLIFTVNTHAHERLTIGPNGGRLIAIDSQTTPNAEFRVTADRRFQIGFINKDGKPLPVGERKLTITAGDRSDPKKLATEIKGDLLVTEVAPEGDDYHVIMQLREMGSSKSKTFRVHLNTAVCGECKKPEWICECGNKSSGKNVSVPETLEGLWAEINHHVEELHEETSDKAYEAVDEVTEALPVLASALPGKTAASNKPQVSELVAELKAALGGIRDTFAARKPADAKDGLGTVEKTIAKLKAQYPAEVANAKLKE